MAKYLKITGPAESEDEYIVTPDGNGLEWVSGTEVLTSGPREAFFVVTDTDLNYNNYRVQNVSGSGSYKFLFSIPTDFQSLIGIEAVFAPTAGASGTGKNIDLYSSYGAVGQSVTQYSESNTSATYDLGSADVWHALNLGTVFTHLAAGQICGINVDNVSIGGYVRFAGIRLRYNS